MLKQMRGFLAAAVAATALLAVLPVGVAAAGPSPSCQIDPQCDDFRPVFYQDYAPGDGPVVRSIFRINPDGTDRGLIIRDATFPSVDRARAQIAFIRAGEVWLAKIDGSDQQRVTDRAAGTAYDVSLSPDGDYLAYTAGAVDRIVVHRLGSSDRCSGFSDSNGGPLQGWGPRWSPDGVHLAYVTTGDGAGIGIARCDGTDRRVVLREPAGVYVDWSEDGRRVVYGGANAMAWIDVQTPGVGHPIPNTSAIAGSPSWSPDGQRIVISRLGTPNRGLWTVRLDGSEAVKIADIGDHSGRPDWGYPAAPVVALP